MVTEVTIWNMDVPMPSMTVPIRADKLFKDAFAAYCRHLGKPMSEVVADAILQVHGEKLKPFIHFVANHGNQNDQTEEKDTKS